MEFADRVLDRAFVLDSSMSLSAGSLPRLY